jgi:hypothetical protein
VFSAKQTHTSRICLSDILFRLLHPHKGNERCRHVELEIRNSRVALRVALNTDIVRLLLELESLCVVLLFDIVPGEHTQRIADLRIVWVE